ncbi:MAG: hypothetical protein EA376_05535 [Phycisphaeraceae bacterium]|nr:MAG: hypothetical protein EA376_05535 [Phycisphaeraceae bacterium]
MARQSDGEYARTLMKVLEEDCKRMGGSEAWSSIVLWEAEELQRQASKLTVSSEIAREMRLLADQARARVRETRAQTSKADAA